MSTRVTLRHIAQSLGISVMTVSRALNNRANVDEGTRNEVMQMARKLGYQPDHIAKSLVLKKTNTIGVVIPEISHSFFPDAIKGIEEVISDAFYNLILAHSAENSEKEKKAITTLEQKRVDGLLISTAENVENFDFYKQLIDREIPVVFFDRCVYNLGVSCVSINDLDSAYKITEHLIEHGYKNIGHLNGPPQVSIGQRRLTGYIDALNDYNLPFSSDWMVESGFHEKGGYRAMMQILDLPESEYPEAIFAVNDPAAFGAMEAIEDTGYSIPEDFAIVGFTDDIHSNLVKTPLTTMRQPAYELGRTAAKTLIGHIDEDAASPQNSILESEMIIRKSCGC